jgi:hypothetical protein
LKKEDKSGNLPPEVKAEDYYFNEKGLMVFTEKYHLKRGNCCKNGCLHCPWRFKKNQKENQG